MVKVIPVTPCYQCQDRRLGCHDECRRYKEYAKKNAKERIKRRFQENKNIVTADKTK